MVTIHITSRSESAAKAASMSEIPGQSSGPHYSCDFETTINHLGLLETFQFAVRVERGL